MFGKSKSPPKYTVDQVMTANPTTISVDHHLITAKKLMAQQGIRHLPVIEARELYGVISERDVMLAESVYKGHKDRDVRIKDLCVGQVYAAEVGSDLKEALSIMLEKKYGCTVVTKQGVVVGIFTVFDAVKLLSQLLKGT